MQNSLQNKQILVIDDTPSILIFLRVSLEALGATRVAFVRERWWVMEAPTGHRFCIVRRQRKDFGPHLNEWPR